MARRLWIIGTLLLGCVLLGKACRPPNQCISKDLCSVEALPFLYRSGLPCKAPNVCCEEWANRGQDKTTNSPVLDSEIQDPRNFCGLSNRKDLDASLKVSSDQARFGEFPWTIALFSNDKYLGGGSLIAPGVVLTAAHLLLRKSEANVVVRAGEWNLSTTAEEIHREERQVNKIVRHEGFDYLSGNNNLALLFLDTPFAMKDHIRTICLPSKVQSFEGKRCIVAGWGRRSFPETHHSNILKKIELPLVNRGTCQRQLKNTVLGVTFTLAPSLICAGGELDQDACLGDGGSALFCALEEDPDRYEQAGIVNWGVECGKQDVPATYTNVAMFTDWIYRQLAQVVLKLETRYWCHLDK